MVLLVDVASGRARLPIATRQTTDGRCRLWWRTLSGRGRGNRGSCVGRSASLGVVPVVVPMGSVGRQFACAELGAGCGWRDFVARPEMVSVTLS